MIKKGSWCAMCCSTYVICWPKDLCSRWFQKSACQPDAHEFSRTETKQVTKYSVSGASAWGLLVRGVSECHHAICRRLHIENGVQLVHTLLVVYSLCWWYLVSPDKLSWLVFLQFTCKASSARYEDPAWGFSGTLTRVHLMLSQIGRVFILALTVRVAYCCKQLTFGFACLR